MRELNHLKLDYLSCEIKDFMPDELCNQGQLDFEDKCSLSEGKKQGSDAGY